MKLAAFGESVLRRGYLYPVRRADGAIWRAKWEGEKRPPRKGEWYFSGSVVEAYRSGGDMSYPYHIAELVRGRVSVVWEGEGI